MLFLFSPVHKYFLVIKFSHRPLFLLRQNLCTVNLFLPHSLFLPSSYFYYLMNFITVIGVQQSSQPILQHFHPKPSVLPPPPNLSHFETISFSKSVSQYLFCEEVHCGVFLDYTCKWYSIWCWCLIVWLTSLSMIIPRSIHVAAKAIISFLLMAE